MDLSIAFFSVALVSVMAANTVWPRTLVHVWVELTCISRYLPTQVTAFLTDPKNTEKRDVIANVYRKANTKQLSSSVPRRRGSENVRLWLGWSLMILGIFIWEDN
jgi:hypothetical protein